MTGYDAYCTFQSLKLHFSDDKYNFFLYNGKTKTSVDSFEKRKDKYAFHKLARDHQADLVNFMMCNFVYRDISWSRSLLEPEAERTYEKWKKTTSSLEDVYKEELLRVCSESSKFDGLFRVIDGQHPELFVAYMQLKVGIETLVILNNMFGYLKIWDKEIQDDVLYPKVSKKVRKYSAFLTVNVPKFKALTKNTLLGDRNAI